MQPTAVKELLEIFNCKLIDDKKFILSSLDISCENSEYIAWRNQFYIPILCFWIVLFPLFCLGKLVINSKNLDLPHIKLFFGFFYLGYKPEYYFWEFVIMYRKIIMILVTIIPDNRIFSKGYIVLFVNACAAYFQKVKSPFNDRALNALELKADIASMFTIFIGMFYLMNIPDYLKAICFVVILITNIFFLLCWLKFLFYVTFKSIIDNYFIKKFCPLLPKKILTFIKG